MRRQLQALVIGPHLDGPSFPSTEQFSPCRPALAGPWRAVPDDVTERAKSFIYRSRIGKYFGYVGVKNYHDRILRKSTGVFSANALREVVLGPHRVAVTFPVLTLDLFLHNESALRLLTRSRARATSRRLRRGAGLLPGTVRSGISDMLSDEALLFLEGHPLDCITQPVADLTHGQDRIKFFLRFFHQRRPPSGFGSQAWDSLAEGSQNYNLECGPG